MPFAIEGYRIAYTFSDKIYRIHIPSQHKVTETQQIHWTTKTITPLEITMEPLLAEESYATVYPLSHPIATGTIEKADDQDRSGQIIQATLKQFSSKEPSKEFSLTEDFFRKYLNDQPLHRHL